MSAQAASEPAAGDELRCVGRSCRDDDGRPRPRRGGHLLCDTCDGRARRLPDALAARYVALGRALVPGARARSERIAAPKPGSRSPVDDAALHVRDDVAALLIGCAGRAVDELGLSAPPRGNESRRVQHAARLLTAQWERLRLTAITAHFSDRASRLHADADHVLGLDRLVHRLPAPCPACDSVTLARRDGDELVRCSRCHAGWTGNEYRRLVFILADELRRNGE